MADHTADAVGYGLLRLPGLVDVSIGVDPTACAVGYGLLRLPGLLHQVGHDPVQRGTVGAQAAFGQVGQGGAGQVD